MGDLFLVLGWGSPIGIGIFLLCPGGMIFLLSKATLLGAGLFSGWGIVAGGIGAFAGIYFAYKFIANTGGF